METDEQRPIQRDHADHLLSIHGERGERMEADLQSQSSSYRINLLEYALWQNEADVQALTLLEFLVKNGSERVVDDARAHVSTIKMLRSFHYIDEKGKDQGINGMPSAMNTV